MSIGPSWRLCRLGRGFYTRSLCRVMK
jgi:hypothetical protein